MYSASQFQVTNLSFAVERLLFFVIFFLNYESGVNI